MALQELRARRPEPRTPLLHRPLHAEGMGEPRGGGPARSSRTGATVRRTRYPEGALKGPEHRPFAGWPALPNRFHAAESSESPLATHRENPTVSGAFPNGRCRARTSDLLLVRQALSQLS